jgi:hypothetical protein
MRSMAGRWSDQDIAASLNRMGMPTGQGKTRTAPPTSQASRSLPHSSERVARVGSIQKNRFQCFQRLEKEVQNESVIIPAFGSCDS